MMLAPSIAGLPFFAKSRGRYQALQHLPAYLGVLLSRCDYHRAWLLFAPLSLPARDQGSAMDMTPIAHQTRAGCLPCIAPRDGTMNLWLHAANHLAA